jgi:hypothetical protein
MSDFETNLQRCAFSAEAGSESAESIAQLEVLIGVQLPSDYRQFLVTIGGGHLDGWADCTVPTPFGAHGITTVHTVAQVIDLLDSAVTPRNLICIGYGDFGATTCLSIAGIDHGQVFSLDTEMRFSWGDAELSRFPNLDPVIREFFRMRDADELASRPWGYDHCYHVANSFREFIAKIHRSEDQ